MKHDDLPPLGQIEAEFVCFTAVGRLVTPVTSDA